MVSKGLNILPEDVDIDWEMLEKENQTCMIKFWLPTGYWAFTVRIYTDRVRIKDYMNIILAGVHDIPY